MSSSAIQKIYEEINSTLNSPEGKEKESLFYEKAKKELRFRTAPMPVLFHPYILSQKQYIYVKTVTEKMLQIIEKAISLFLVDDSLRKYYRADDFLLKLVDKNPGFKMNVPGARFDSYFDGEENLRFIEINAEGVACMEWNYTLNKLFGKIYPGKELENCDFNAQNLMGGVLESLLECYGQFASEHKKEKPSIAIVDWLNSSTSTEFEAFRDYFNSRGHESVVAAPSELNYDGNRLSCNKLEIDIVYRRLLTVEYLPEYEKFPALGDAYLDSNVCIVHPFRSYVGFNKKLFAFLWSDSAKKHFSKDDILFIKKHIPWTVPLDSGNVLFEGKETDLSELLKNNKDRFILKPTSLYDGAGVMLGDLTEQHEWNNKIDTELNRDYLVQEKINPPEFETHDGRKLVRHLGEYLWNGKLTGFMTRAGTTDLINAANTAMKVPTFVLKD